MLIESIITIAWRVLRLQASEELLIDGGCKYFMSWDRATGSEGDAKQLLCCMFHSGCYLNSENSENAIWCAVPCVYEKLP